MFSVRLVNADSYQAQPLPQLDPTFSEFRGSEIKHVPIIRIFGTTPTGEKTCLHIHGVFPYLYVPYTGEEDPINLAYRLSASLDAAINVSLGSATSNTQHVYLIQRVSGIPFYGYHRKEHQYLKIYFYNPAMIKRAADLLQNGSVLNQSLQPHEAHIPYILQFMMDYNVYGMSLVNLSNVKHRRLTPTLAELTSSGQSTMSENSDIEYLPATIERQSTCEVEIDALASDIMNRREIESGLELNPGLAAIWEEERARRAQAGFQGGDSQLVNPKSPPRPTFRPTDNDIYQEQRLARRLLMISQCDESTLSTTPNQSVAYAAEVNEGENLLNSSNVLFSHPTAERTQVVDQDDTTLHANFLNSFTEAASQRMTPDCSILGTDDAQLIDLLVQLADEGGENQDSIDLDSLLGSQVPALRNDEKSDNEDEDDDVLDLNLTSLQLDSLNSLEMPAQQANEASSDRNNLSPIDLSPFILSYETSNSSRSADEGKTTKRCQVPQYDGAGDVSPTLLNSDDEDNDTHPKEFSHLPEYNGACDSASKSRKFDKLDDTLKLPPSTFVASKDSDESDERCRSSSSLDAARDSSILPPVLVADEYISQYNDANYEPLDRLLEIGPDFVPDLEGLHTSMEIGILLSSADSDSPESVDEILEDDAIPLETVLNGDPCFTESAELDKSDLTELQDQYVSLLGNSLLPDVHTNLRVDSDLGSVSHYSDSDYQTGEKTCEILLNVRSPRSSIASRGSSSSSENVAPNIQEPETRNCTKGKSNASYELDRESWNCKDSTRISTDNSDYNCNVVATWAELQNLQFVEKEKIEGRLGRSKERGQNAQGTRQNRRRASRRSDERAASQILRLDGEKITNNTATLAPHQVNNNCPLSPRKIVTNSETKSPIKINTNSSLAPIDAEVTISETRLTETLVNITENKCPESPRVPPITTEVEIEEQSSFAETETHSRLDLSHETTIGSGNDTPNAEHSLSAIGSVENDENVTKIVDSEESPENCLKKLNEPLRTKEIPEGYSYYSFERSQRDYKVGGIEHWHCMLTKHNTIVQDEVFTSDKVWVIEKRKRGRQSKRLCGGSCMRGDCSLPIVPLKKIVDKNQENSIIGEDSLKVEETELPVDEKTAEPSETKIEVSATDTSVEISIAPKNRSIDRKSRIRRQLIDSSSSDSNSDVISISAEPPVIDNNEKEESINEPVNATIPEKEKETKNPESTETTEAEESSFGNESLNAGDLAHNSYGIKRRCGTRKKRSRTRNSRKIISRKSSRTTRNGLVRSVTRLAKHEKHNLPGIPGDVEYRSNDKQGRPRKGVFNCYNGVPSENMPTETARKTRNKTEPALFTNCRRPNGLVNCVQNGLSGDRKNAVSPDRRTINSPQYSFPPLSPIQKRKPHDNSKNVSFSLNRSSTPKKVATEIHDLTEDKLSECMALNLMMGEVKSRSTRAKLKILLEKRKNNIANSSREKETTTGRRSLSSEKPLKEIKIETPIALENPEPPPISVTENSGEMEKIDDEEEADNADDNLEQSFETVTDVSATSHKILEPEANSIDVIDDTGIPTSSTLNTDIRNTENDEPSGIFEAELEVLASRITEVNPVEELFNERKELSYHTDRFTSTIAETNFFSGNNYTIDAVSLEIPACLFEEDSNSVDKRSPSKVPDSKISNDSQNAHDVYSDISIDYRDLDVYDVDSLTPCSSLATLNEVALDGTETSLNFSEATESSIFENSTFSESQSVSTCLEKSVCDSKSEGILESSFEEASPEFEALSPSPKICDLTVPLKEEFAVHSRVVISETGQKFNYSLTYTTDDSQTEMRGEKMGTEEENSALDHEIQDLVSQVVVQIENESNYPCESESLIIEFLEPFLNTNSEEIAEEIEIVNQRIEKPQTITRTEQERQMRIVAPEKDEKWLRKNEPINSATSESIVEVINPCTKETDSKKVDLLAIVPNNTQSDILEPQIEFQQTVTQKSDLIDRRLELKDENKELDVCLAKKSTARDGNDFVDATQNGISSKEELRSISKVELPNKSPKCRTVSIKLVNIDLSRFEGFRPKNLRYPNVTKAESVQQTFNNNEIENNSLLSSACNYSDDSFENITPVKMKIKEPTTFDTVETFEKKNPMESTAPIEISDKDEQIEDSIPMESAILIETPKKDKKFVEETSKKSSTTIVISDESETFEMATSMETRSHNHARNKTKRIFKRSRLPARRSRRKCAEKTRQKLSKLESSQLSSTESEALAKASEIVVEIDSPTPESPLHEKSEDLATHEIMIQECELINNPPSLKYASTCVKDVHSPYFTEEESSTVEVKAQESLMEKRDRKNSLESVLSLQKIPDENKAPYVKWGKRCRSENSSQGNSRDTSPGINPSTEENTSADENVKPKTLIYWYSKKQGRRSCRKRLPVPPQFKLAMQKKALQKQIKVSSDSTTLIQPMSSDKTDAESPCSLQYRSSSQNIADTNTEKPEAESKLLGNEKKSLRSDLVTRIIDASTINSQSSQTPRRRNRSAKVPETKPSIVTEAIFGESTQETAARKSIKPKVVSEEIVKNNDVNICLDDQHSGNTSDGSELCASKIVVDEELGMPANLRRRGLREKITKLRSRQASSKSSSQDIAKTNSEEFVSSEKEIPLESADIFVGSKRRRRTKKISSSSADESYSEISPSQEDTTQNTVEKTSETIEEYSLLSRKIGEEVELNNSDNAEVLQMCNSNASLEKSAEDITGEISQEVELTSPKIMENNTESATFVKATKKGRLRTFLQPDVQKSSVEVISLIEENVQGIDEKTSDISKLISKSPQKTKKKDKHSTILASAEISNLNEDITEEISQELELSSQAIAEKTEQETFVKTKKRGSSRKDSVPKIEEPSTESVTAIVQKEQSIDEKNTDNSKESQSQKVEKNYSKSKTSDDKKTPTKNSENTLAEQSIERLSSQDILERRTEPKSHVKDMKREGRSRKISAQHLRKPIEAKSQDVDEKTYKIVEELKLSQNVEQKESESTNSKDEIPELDISKPAPAEKNAQLNEGKKSAVSSNKIDEEDVKFETSVRPSLHQISTDKKYKENSESLTEEKSRNIQKKVSPESDSPSSSAEEDTESKTPQKITNFQPNNQKPSSEHKSTPAETTKDFDKEDLEENTSSLPNSAAEKVAPIIFIETTKRNRSRKKRRPDNARFSEAEPSMKENDQDNCENSQKPEILSQAVEEPEIITKKRGRSEKSPQSIDQEVHTEENLKSISHAVSEASEKTRATSKRRSRPEKRPESIDQEVHIEENSESVSHVVSDPAEKTLATPRRRSRPEKRPESIDQEVHIEENSEAISHVVSDPAEKTLATPRRRSRSGKTTESDFLKPESAEENSEKATEEKSLKETEVSQKIADEFDERSPAIQPRINGRLVTITKKVKPSAEKGDYDTVNATSLEAEVLLQRITDTRLEIESKNVMNKLRQRKISTTITEDTSQGSTSSLEEICLKSSPEKLEESDTESKNSVITNKRSCTARKSEVAEKSFKEKPGVVIAPKITEHAAEPKSPSRSKKRTRSERSPESKPENSELSEKPIKNIFDERLSESNLSPQKVPNKILETQTPRRSQKRVRFDEDSIRECIDQLRTSKSFIDKEIEETSPNKHKKYSLTLNRDSSPTKTERSDNNSQSEEFRRTTRAKATNLNRDVFELKDQQYQRQTKNSADREENNGVAAKSECTISSSDNASLDLPSLQGGVTRHRRHDNLRGIPERATKSRVQDQAIQSEQKQTSLKMQLNDSELVVHMKKISFVMNSELSRNLEPMLSKPFVLNQEPNIILQRLSRDTLKTYGIEFNAKNKTFVKNLKKHRPDSDYQVPAYDGPADFSSSESDDEPADVTIAREEKRVCVYQSGKKASNTRRESIVTPRKRKFDDAEDAQSPTSKHRAIATPGPSSKTPFSSPNRTSMLKSPGRVSGYYPPLQIIVTSPKVRKETSEARDTDVRLENRDVPASTSTCFTPRRKNDQRLHENLLRGRISTMKSPKNVIGDKRASLAMMGSQRPGELDEIKSGKKRERIALNISTITNECAGATGNEILTSTIRDGKDVRKKLVFSTAGHERHTVQIPNEGLDHQSANLQTSTEPIGHFSIENDARKSLGDLENLANRETTTLDSQPGPSHTEDVPVDKNLAPYEVTTDEESEDDDVCNVTFTQYIDSQIEKNQVLTLDRNKIAEDTKEIVSLRPKFNPPNSQRIIETMESYGIPKYRNQEPFFSNEVDVPKQKEVAQKMLKVPGKGLKDLPPFISTVEGITGLARWRKMKVNELQPALTKSKDINATRAIVGNDIISLTPLIKPPTQKDVRNWLRARNYLEKKKKRQEEMAKQTKETQEIEIQGKIAGTDDEVCESNDLDLSVIEASPEKVVGGTDSGKIENCTLKIKLANRGLFKKTEDFKKNKIMPSCSKKAKDSVKESSSGEGNSKTQNSSSTEIDPSLMSVLGKSGLFKDQEPSRHLGVSCGQIEFLSDSTRSNVAEENLQNAKALTRYQYLTIMCLEVHVTTRGNLLPDAQHDSISAIFYSVQSDVPPTSNIKPLEHGVIVLADEEKAKNKMHYSYASNIPWSICFANNEEALLNALVTLITRTDPEILIGWELETLSWGYVFQRATRLGMNLSKRISRIPATQCKWETPAPDIESMAEVKLPGRIVLDIWRMMRHEAALLSYTFESVMHHVLNERVPCPSFKILTDWWNLERPRSSRWRVIEHYSLRVLGVFRMLDQLDIIGRTSELARLFGIQFYEVFSRGSQFRVESVMLRLAKPLNYIAVSPSPLQRASMRAMEALPLILEPESKFYTDPLIVLDFQSLYPSIIIAHNYCFSTCLGRIEHIGQPQPFEFGAYTLRVSKSTALKLEGKVNYAPCGVAYVKPEVRLGILPRMLTEILDTRLMVKKAMKDHKQADKTLQRALHSRQLGLKFLANVTYGYTAANFSGRMPCIEVGDSVISKSKETLERAIKLVEATPKWGARVVYGDTDSLFILVPGKSKAEAFVIGNEIADAVTASNPPPIKLKFEKVMYPSILQTKKRYCGYMYETPDQETPTYLAKGIETVRRDGCPAVSKILEKTLKILFETKDVSLVKMYVTRQLDKILRGKVSIQDLTFAKEFRGLKGYKAKACVPALELTRRLMRKDPRAVPRNSERVRYVIVAGAPNQALIHCVRTPWELINDPGLRPNAIYYVTRVIIPPLNRCLNLMGVDVNAWYREMPHRQILNNPVGQPLDKQKLTIFQYFGTIVCVSCGQPSSKGICTECLTCPADTLVVLHEKLRRLHRTYDQVTAICQSCVGQTDVADCSSLDCPVLYRRAQAQRELSQTTHLRDIIEYGNNLEF